MTDTPILQKGGFITDPKLIAEEKIGHMCRRSWIPLTPIHRKKICDGNCYNEIKAGNNPATWKVIMNKAYQKEYGRKPMYFCDDCLQDLIGGVWSGGGPYGSNVKKMIRI